MSEESDNESDHVSDDGSSNESDDGSSNESGDGSSDESDDESDEEQHPLVEKFKTTLQHEGSFRYLEPNCLFLSHALSLDKFELSPKQIIRRCEFILTKLAPEDHTVREELYFIIHIFEDEKLAAEYFKKSTESYIKYIKERLDELFKNPNLSKTIKNRREIIRKHDKIYNSLTYFKKSFHMKGDGLYGIGHCFTWNFMRNKGSVITFPYNCRYDIVLSRYRTLLQDAIIKYESATYKYSYIRDFEIVADLIHDIDLKVEVSRVKHIIKGLKKELWAVVNIEGVLDSATPIQIHKISCIFGRNNPSPVFFSMYPEYFTLFLFRKYKNTGIISKINRYTLSFLFSNKPWAKYWLDIYKFKN